MLVEDPRPNGTSELLRENGGFHAGAWLEPCRSHQLGPLGTVRPCGVAVSQVDRNVRGFVAGHFTQQLLRFLEKSRVEPDLAGGRMAAAEGGSEAPAGFELDTFGEGRERPGSSPLG